MLCPAAHHERVLLPPTAAVWYSVDLPKGQDVPRPPQQEHTSGNPQLFLLNVSASIMHNGALSGTDRVPLRLPC